MDLTKKVGNEHEDVEDFVEVTRRKRERAVIPPKEKNFKEEETKQDQHTG